MPQRHHIPGTPAYRQGSQVSLGKDWKIDFSRGCQHNSPEPVARFLEFDPATTSVKEAKMSPYDSSGTVSGCDHHSRPDPCNAFPISPGVLGTILTEEVSVFIYIFAGVTFKQCKSSTYARKRSVKWTCDHTESPLPICPAKPCFSANRAKVGI